MKLNIYLAGLISTEKPESLEWRDALLERWADYPHVNVISPMSQKSGLAQHSKDGGITDNRLQPGDILLRDYQDVMRSELIIANLNLWGSSRPMLGTWPELGWSWEHHKPVLGIATPGDSNWALATNHPFVRGFVAHYFFTPEDAADFVESYYIRK